MFSNAINSSLKKYPIQDSLFKEVSVLLFHPLCPLLSSPGFDTVHIWPTNIPGLIRYWALSCAHSAIFPIVHTAVPVLFSLFLTFTIWNSLIEPNRASSSLKQSHTIQLHFNECMTKWMRARLHKKSRTPLHRLSPHNWMHNRTRCEHFSTNYSKCICQQTIISMM